MEQSNLSLIDLDYINSEVIKKRKNIWKAYALTSLFGMFGAHHFYLEKKTLGLIKAWFGTMTVLVFLISKFGPENISNILSIISIVMIIVSFLWNVYDLFSIEKILSNMDKENEKKILESLVNQNAISKGENHAKEQEVND